MSTDVKLNAEGLPDDFLDQLRAECEGEYGEKVVGKQTLWRIVTELLARRAIDNSKPIPAVGDDGLVERGVGVIARMARMRGAVGDTEAIVTWMHEARTALAAAHAQHEVDAARIKELERLATDRRYMLDAYRNMLGETGLKVAAKWDENGVQRVHYDWGPAATDLTGEERAAFILTLDDIALAKVKP